MSGGEFKYRIGKLKQTPSVQVDDQSGSTYIDLKARDDEKVYGCTTFAGHYKQEDKLGQGTFGEVYKGVHIETQRQVALKKILIGKETELFPITAQREIIILRKLAHKNVVKLIEMIYDDPPTSEASSRAASTSPASQFNQAQALSPSSGKSFYMVLPYMVADLAGILHNPRISLQMADIKNMMLQLLEGVNYIHCQKYMHRDIKAANILIDHQGVLKLADFGLARIYYGSPPNVKYPGGAGMGAKYTSVVVTRWYRAPELVLGDKYYTTAVDIWGVGCVFAEFFEKKPILQGTTDVDQGHVIFKLLGTPTEEDWPMAKYLPGAELVKTNYKETLTERFGKFLGEQGLDLLRNLLALDPYKRLTAMAAKKHPFFKEDPLPTEKLQLPSEESHESDIKRYNEDMHQAMSQKAPSAPKGHVVESETSQPKFEQENFGLKGGNKIQRFHSAHPQRYDPQNRKNGYYESNSRNASSAQTAYRNNTTGSRYNPNSAVKNTPTKKIPTGPSRYQSNNESVPVQPAAAYKQQNYNRNTATGRQQPHTSMHSRSHSGYQRYANSKHHFSAQHPYTYPTGPKQKHDRNNEEKPSYRPQGGQNEQKRMPKNESKKAEDKGIADLY